MGKSSYVGILLGLLLPNLAWAGQTFNAQTGRGDFCITVETEDQSVQNLSCLPVRVPNTNLTNNTSYFSLDIPSGGSSEWTDTGSILHPNESGTDEIAIGGTTEAGADIFLGVDGFFVFNEQGNDVDGRFEGDSDTQLIYLDAGLDTVTIGSSTSLGKLGIDGDQDEIQLIVQGNSTQTSNNFVVEKSDGTDLFSIGAGGDVITSGTVRLQGITYRFPTADGSSGQVIHTDGSGNLYFADDDGAASGDIEDVFSCTTGSCQSITVQSGDTLKIDDDVDLQFGAAPDWLIQYDEGVDDQLLFATAKTSAIATTDPMFEILVDTGAAGMTANQQVFGIGVGSQASNTAIFTIDEDGDVAFTGTITGNGSLLTSLDGENIQDDTIDDDSIDFSDVTGADLTLTDAGAITSSGTITATVGFDCVGAADCDYGSADITDHTFVTDGTGDAEIVLPNDSIGDDEIDWSGLTTSADFTVTGTLLTTVGVDGVGAVDLDYGSADVTDHTFVADGGTVVIDGSITQDAGTTLFMGGLLDATGAVDMDYGSADITDHTFTADGGTVILDGTITADGLTLSAGELITLGSTTLSESTDLIINNDVEIQDATPHLRFTDTTASEDDFEIYADASKFIFSNVTDGKEILAIGASNEIVKFNHQLTRCAVVENLAAADDNIPLGSLAYPTTIKNFWCTCSGTCTTVAQVSLEDGSGNAMTHTTPTCTAIGTIPQPQAITAGGGLNAYESVRFDVDNTPSPETDEYELCYSYIAAE
jgi:hypothetical protein